MEFINNDHPVYELSEIRDKGDECAVLLGVEKYRDEIITELDRRGFRYFF